MVRRASAGDDPAFVTGMVTWSPAHAGTGPGQLAYEGLFNAPQDDGDLQLFGAAACPGQPLPRCSWWRWDAWRVRRGW